MVEKFTKALASAHALLGLNDYDGACDRAYYAMFDAARAALLAARPPFDVASVKTHDGLIAAFSMRLVKDGPLPAYMGRWLNRAEELRLIADYTGRDIGASAAAELLGQADAFVETICRQFNIRQGVG
jgi:uncharacterized protein (UPF0332 family)